MIIIGITGKKTHGKTTFANYLKKEVEDARSLPRFQKKVL